MNTTAYDDGRAPAVPQRNAFGNPPSRQPTAPAQAGSPKWLVPALLVLSALPLAAGAFRLTELAGGAAITPANARFFASPLPVVLHAVIQVDPTQANGLNVNADTDHNRCGHGSART